MSTHIWQTCMQVTSHRSDTHQQLIIADRLNIQTSEKNSQLEQKNEIL